MSDGLHAWKNGNANVSTRILEDNPTTFLSESFQQPQQNETPPLLNGPAPFPSLNPHLEGSTNHFNEPKPLLSAKRGFSPALLSLVPSMVQELWENSQKLLTLNPSRRESILTHLQSLAKGHTPPKATLKDWIENQKNQIESRAFSAYFEEISVLALSQMLLLKRWFELKSLKLEKSQLSRINFELADALKPFLPLHRESWHLTRPNIYSWYTPSPSMIDEIDHVLHQFSMCSEGPSFILDLCNESRRYQPVTPELLGYDSRFHSTLLKNLKTIGVETDPLPFNRKRLFYTPSLRMGEMISYSPKNTQWIGFENNLFLLLIAEIKDLWFGPKDPPDWVHGHSFEAHPREQLSLTPQNSPKAGVSQFLAEVEACDFSYVLEEETTRVSKYKHVLETYPFLKKLMGPTTSMGMLKACIAITKLRPYGKMLWARETPLTPEDGNEALQYLFSKGTLLTEWDLSLLEHSLPTKLPLFPKHVYCFEREIDTEKRSAHRPKRVQLTGSLKSHIEVIPFFEDLIHSGMIDPSLISQNIKHPWKIHGIVSPTSQKEWLTHWPTQTKSETIETLEKLQESSIPLANLGTIRHLSQKEMRPEWKGMLIESVENPRELKVTPFSHRNTDQLLTGFALFLTDDLNTATIRQYLESAPVQTWLEHHAERRGEKWILSEGLLKMIPFPNSLHQSLLNTASFEWSAHVNALSKNPIALLPDSIEITKHFQIFSLAIHETETSLFRLSQYIKEDGTVVWKNILKLIPVNEICPIPHSTLLNLEGKLPIHSAIIRVERIRGNQNGITLMTESGATLRITSQNKVLIDMIHSQSTHFVHPTWSELIDWIRIPRNLNYAETLKQDLELNAYDLKKKLNRLRERIRTIKL